jgi:hypothetical protein
MLVREARSLLGEWLGATATSVRRPSAKIIRAFRRTNGKDRDLAAFRKKGSDDLGHWCCAFLFMFELCEAPFCSQVAKPGFDQDRGALLAEDVGKVALAGEERLVGCV